MKKNNVKTLLICAMCVALASCGNSLTAAESSTAAGETSTEAETSASSGSTTAPESSSGSGDKAQITASVTASVDADTAVAEASDMFTNRDYEVGYSDAVEVKLTSDGGSVFGSGVTAEDNIVRITEAGTYRITGTISDGQIVVDAADDAKIQIVLDNASVTCSGSAALYVKNADKVFVTTASGSTNTLASTGEFVQSDDNNVDGAVFAKSDITFNGGGVLNVSSDTKHGIVCKDDLKFTGGTYNITAEKKGIDCKESVRTAGGTISITSGTDGIHTENTDKPEKAFVYICGGEITINSGNDAIDADGEVTVTDGTLNITADGGAANAPAHTNNDFGGNNFRWDRDSSSSDGETSESCKGIKSAAQITVTGGTINIDASDDSMHSDGSVIVNGGSITASTGDDGIHAEDTVLIADGSVNITKSYEGIEGEIIEVSGGSVNVTASDDGMNAAGGETTSGWGMMDTDANAKLTISGGEVYVNATGDGLDSNGYLYVTGGRTFVSGPTNSGNGALDSGIEATITGGYIIAAGSTGMAENFGSASTQGSILYTFDGTVQGGSEISISDSSGNVLLSFTPEKNYQCAVISTPEIAAGNTYTVTAGGTDYTVEMTSNIYGASNGMGGFGGGMGGFGGGNNGGFGGRRSRESTDTGDNAGTQGNQQMPSDGMPEMNGEMPQMPENGEMPQMPENDEMPQMPENGEMPQMPENGEMPQMPENGEMPQMPGNGEMPQMPDGGFGEGNFGGRGGFGEGNFGGGREGRGGQMQKPGEAAINNSDTSQT